MQVSLTEAVKYVIQFGFKAIYGDSRVSNIFV